MDLNAAILAHTNWKLKIFTAAKSGNQEKLNPAAVGRDNACPLGQWLYGEGKTLLVGTAEYRELLKTHAEFHRHVAALITQINQGNSGQAETAVNDKSSAFSQTSLKVVSLLMKLKAAS